MKSFVCRKKIRLEVFRIKNKLHWLNIVQQHRVQLNMIHRCSSLDHNRRISEEKFVWISLFSQINFCTVLSIVLRISVKPLITSENLNRLSAIKHSLFCSKFKRI